MKTKILYRIHVPFYWYSDSSNGRRNNPFIEIEFNKLPDAKRFFEKALEANRIYNKQNEDSIGFTKDEDQILDDFYDELGIDGDGVINGKPKFYEVSISIKEFDLKSYYE